MRYIYSCKATFNVFISFCLACVLKILDIDIEWLTSLLTTTAYASIVLYVSNIQLSPVFDTIKSTTSST